MFLRVRFKKLVWPMQYLKMNLKKTMNVDSGNTTIEMAIIFPIALFSVMALILFSIISYQKLSLQSTLNSSVDKLSSLIYNGAADAELPQIEEALITELSKSSIFGQDRCLYDVHVIYDKGFFSNKLRVEAETLIVLPIGKWIKTVGINNPFRIYAYTEKSDERAKVFIDNVDLLIDIAKRSELDDKLKALSGKD